PQFSLHVSPAHFNPIQQTIQNTG
ncbi:flagellar hook-length control FliK family protein, partial [Vibrio parahaemolyticus AQ3810]